MLTIAENISNKGFSVEILVLENKGALKNKVPKNIKIISLNSSRALYSLFGVFKYLRKSKPDVMLSALGHINIVAILAKILSRVKFRLVITEHAVQSILAKKSNKLKENLIPFFIKFFYRFADHVIAVSLGVERNLINTNSISPERITTIYNPIISNFKEENVKKSLIEINENFQNAIYKIVCVGRLAPEKDYITMLKAFEIVKKTLDVHLIILGEGDERAEIETYIKNSNLANYVTLMGFVEEPSSYISACDLLCLSSISEGFGNVLIEALSVGTPVVSTDCPTGPREILKNGLWGELIHVGDYLAMSEAIKRILISGGAVPSVSELIELYGVENITNQYLKTLIPDQSQLK